MSAAREPNLAPSADEAWIWRHRAWLLAIVVLIQVASFNGEWRVGRDSAAYRDIARNIVVGEGYTYRGERVQTHYPGYPVLLASLEALFGPGPLPPLLINQIYVFLTLGFLFVLARRAFSNWVAIASVLALGVNREFVWLSTELLTDLQFLCGMTLCLYGFEVLRPAGEVAASSADQAAAAEPVQVRQLVRGAIAMGFGLILSISTRPTGWILVLALLMTCAWQLLRRRRGALLIASLVLGVAAAWVALDPRVVGIDPTGGGYESRLVSKLQSFSETFGSRLWPKLVRIFEEQLPESMLGIELGPGLNSLFSAVVLFVGLALVRVRVLWGAIILVTFATFATLGAVPRYYLMILPLLYFAWFGAVHKLSARWAPKSRARLRFAALFLVIVPNSIMSGKLIVEQRRDSFLDNYDRGYWVDFRTAAELIKETVPTGERVFGPEPEVLSYWSEREVYRVREFAKSRRAGDWIEEVQAANIDYALFPAKLYSRLDAAGERLIDAQVLIPKDGTAQGDEPVVLPCRIDATRTRWWAEESK